VNPQRNSLSWLTARRVRTHGLLLAICLWTVYAADLATPGLRDPNGLIKGTDFLHFYTLGKIALLGRGDLLYDMRGQSELMERLVPEARGYSYVSLYGAQVSLLFAPLAKLAYGYALTAWLLLNVVIYATCCFTVWRRCPMLQKERWTVLILAAAFPGFFHLLAWGQTSGVALHPGLSCPGEGKAIPGRPRHRMSDFQTSAWPGRSRRVPVLLAMASPGGRNPIGGCPTLRGMADLRHCRHAPVLGGPDSYSTNHAAVGATSLPDAFGPRLLEPSASLAAACIRTLRSDQRSGSAFNRPVLAQ
jgi:hypothetical protein